MAGIFDNKSHIISPSKSDASSDMASCGCIDRVHGVVTQVTLRIMRIAKGSIDGNTPLNGWIRVSRRKLGQPRVCVPVVTYLLATHIVIAITGIAWFGNRLVVDEFPVDCVV